MKHFVKILSCACLLVACNIHNAFALMEAIMTEERTIDDQIKLRVELPLAYEPICIVGAGYGAGIAQALSSKHSPVLIDTDKETVDYINKFNQHPKFATSFLSDKILATTEFFPLQHAKHIFLAIPSDVLLKFCEEHKEEFNPDSNIIILSKGLLVEDGKVCTLLDKVQQITGKKKRNIFVMAGASFVGELIIGNAPACLNIAGRNPYETDRLADYFSTDKLYVEPSYDYISLSVTGALKNVAAIGCGIVKGLFSDGNYKNALFAVQSLAKQDIISICKFLSRDDAFEMAQFALPTFIEADIGLTCSNKESRNMSFGIHLAKRYEQEEWTGGLVEGIQAAQCLEVLRKDLPTLRVLPYVLDVINKEISAETFLKRVLTKPEHMKPYPGS